MNFDVNAGAHRCGLDSCATVLFVRLFEEFSQLALGIGQSVLGVFEVDLVGLETLVHQYDDLAARSFSKYPDGPDTAIGNGCVITRAIGEPLCFTDSLFGDAISSGAWFHRRPGNATGEN